MKLLSKLKAFLFKEKKIAIEIVETIDGFWVVKDINKALNYTGPYKREKDAKGVRTRMLKHNG